nr:MAG TPA: hypothetical protein [Caudoviricetes sp.]
MYYFLADLWRLALHWNLLCSYLNLYSKYNLVKLML